MLAKKHEVSKVADTAAQNQEIVQIPFWEMEQHPSNTAALHTPSICLEMQGIRIEIHEQAGGGCDPEYFSCPVAALLGELSGVAKFFLVTGYTDYPRRIIIREDFGYHS